METGNGTLPRLHPQLLAAKDFDKLESNSSPQVRETMKEVIQEAVKLLENGQPGVLATVVRTKGSTPQKPGAMLLVREDGSGVGTLGGGCVEGDIWFAAREILRRHGGPEFKDYFLNEDVAARDGLVCGGTMYFFLEPLWGPEDYTEIGEELIAAYEGGDAVSLATVVNVPEGSANLGAKLLPASQRLHHRRPRQRRA